jgi:RNA polymerase-binding transcription factor DksA
MTNGRTDAFCEILEADADALRRALQSWGEIRTGDREPITLAGQKEFGLILFDRGLRRLRNITAALRRIEVGSFGDCVDCRQPIPGARLAAIPWASRCVCCQEKSEKATIFDQEKIDETTPLRKRSPHAERLRSMVRGAHGSGV